MGKVEEKFLLIAERNEIAWRLIQIIYKSFYKADKKEIDLIGFEEWKNKIKKGIKEDLWNKGIDMNKIEKFVEELITTLAIPA